MIQRFGRTGRAGVGQIVVLIQKGEEENKYRMSKVNSKKIMNVLKEQSSKQTKPDKSLGLKKGTNGG